MITFVFRITKLIIQRTIFLDIICVSLWLHASSDDHSHSLTLELWSLVPCRKLHDFKIISRCYIGICGDRLRRDCAGVSRISQPSNTHWCFQTSRCSPSARRGSRENSEHSGSQGTKLRNIHADPNDDARYVWRHREEYVFNVFCGELELTMTTVNAGSPMLSLEFSYGRFNGEDIRALIEPLTVLVSRIGNLAVHSPF